MQDALTALCPVCGSTFEWPVELSAGRLESDEPCPRCSRLLHFAVEVENGKVVFFEVDED